MSNVFSYHPALFGYPVEGSTTEETTEAFHWQYPSYVDTKQPLTSHHFYQNFINPTVPSTKKMSHARDTENVVIGSGTANGRKMPNFITDSNKKSTGPPKFNRPQRFDKPHGEVTVYVNGQEVRTLDLGTLLRFSKVGAAAFPKPSTLAGQAGAGSNKWYGSTTVGANTENASQSAPGDCVVTHNNGIKTIDLRDKRFWMLPSVTAVKFVLGWMDSAKKTPRGEHVPNCVIPDHEAYTMPFRQVVDIYAAMVLLDVRPPPVAARNQLMNWVTNHRPTVNELQAVHEKLPIRDSVMTRIVTSYFEHAEKGSYDSAEGQKVSEALFNYVVDKRIDPELHSRFEDVQKAREVREKRVRGPSQGGMQGPSNYTGGHASTGGAAIEDVAAGMAALDMGGKGKEDGSEGEGVRVPGASIE